MSEASETQPTRARPAMPRFLPWRHVLTVMGGLLATIALGTFTAAGEAGAIAGSSGFVLGAYASVSRGYRQAVFACVVVMLLGAISIGFYVTAITVASSLVLLVLLLRESVQAGSRVYAMGLLSYLLLTIVGIEFGGSWSMLIPFALGGFVGMGIVRMLGIAQLLPSAPISSAASIAMGVFLAVGLSITLVGMAQVEQQRSYWIVVLFVGRALTPFQGFRAATLRYGVGSLVGAGVAFLILLLELPTNVNLALAAVAAVVGLRMILHPLPFGPGLIAVTILLSIEATQEETLLRVFSVVVAVLLALGLSVIIGWLWQTLNRRFPRQAQLVHSIPVAEAQES